MVCTGAGNGIGAAIVKEGVLHGMKVVVNDIDEAGAKRTLEEVKTMGGEGVMHVSDASLLEDLQALFDLTMKTYGQVDVLVNNAGVAVSGPIWELPVQDINWSTEVNFLGHCYGMRIFMPQMIKQGTPCAVINVASGAGLLVTPHSVMYNTTKAADVTLAENTYQALKVRGIDNIQVHCLCPAYVVTTIHQSDKHRPERYADMSDPYYQSQEYKGGLIRASRGVNSGIPIDSVGMTVFTALEDNKFYIFTHPEAVVPATQWLSSMVNGRNPGE